MPHKIVTYGTGWDKNTERTSEFKGIVYGSAIGNLSTGNVVLSYPINEVNGIRLVLFNVSSSALTTQRVRLYARHPTDSNFDIRFYNRRLNLRPSGITYYFAQGVIIPHGWTMELSVTNNGSPNIDVYLQGIGAEL